MIKQVIGVIPQSCGDYNPERPGGYDKAERVFLFGCEWESKVDGNTYAPAVKDSEGKVIPDEEHWYHCSGMIDAEEATHEHHGLMSAEDKIKLDGIEVGAQKHKAPTSAEVKSALGTGSGTEKFLREDGTWQITLTNGDTITIDLNHVHPQYLKYELVQSLPASPDSGTLYLIAAE